MAPYGCAALNNPNITSSTSDESNEGEHTYSNSPLQIIFHAYCSTTSNFLNDWWLKDWLDELACILRVVKNFNYKKKSFKKYQEPIFKNQTRHFTIPVKMRRIPKTGRYTRIL